MPLPVCILEKKVSNTSSISSGGVGHVVEGHAALLAPDADGGGKLGLGTTKVEHDLVDKIE